MQPGKPYLSSWLPGHAVICTAAWIASSARLQESHLYRLVSPVWTLQGCLLARCLTLTLVSIANTTTPGVPACIYPRARDTAGSSARRAASAMVLTEEQQHKARLAEMLDSQTGRAAGVCPGLVRRGASE
jgi:hypothetical protein